MFKNGRFFYQIVSKVFRIFRKLHTTVAANMIKLLCTVTIAHSNPATGAISFFSSSLNLNEKSMRLDIKTLNIKRSRSQN